MVPTEFPDPDPEHPVALHAVMIPAREVGGDLYDCFEVSPGVLCVAIGDVSGKGMPAALFMARTRSLLRASALQHAAARGVPPRPSEVAATLNVELCKNNPIGNFVTLLLGFLDVASGRFSFVNAGHPRPFRLAAGAAPQEVVTRPGPPLGIMEDIRHADHEIALAVGEALVLMTDGIPEMLAPDDTFYGMPRVVADLTALSDAAPSAITAALAAKVLEFAAGKPAADDVTVLALRRLDPAQAVG
jgi:serine phosphatase RsbU (regulator of sigma subunit)